jgi:hypothetical protein
MSLCVCCNTVEGLVPIKNGMLCRYDWNRYTYGQDWADSLRKEDLRNMIAFQVFSKSKPDINGNFQSLIISYGNTGDILQGYLSGFSKPQVPKELLNLPELPEISLTPKAFNAMLKAAKKSPFFQEID